MWKSSTKNSLANGSLKKNVSIFWLHLLALISSRNVSMRGHLRKGIILIKYQYFRFRIKTGAHFELLNYWWNAPLSTRLLMLEDYNVVHFTIHLDGFKIEICIIKEGTETTLSASCFFTHTYIPLFDLYTTTVEKSWCEVQNALKAV